MTLQGKDQKHVNCPDADALHARQPVDHFLVAQPVQFGEDHVAIPGVARQIANVGGFLRGKPQRAHPRRAELEDAFRGDVSFYRLRQTVEDHTGYAPAELLINNRLDERFVFRFPELNGILADPLDDVR